MGLDYDSELIILDSILNTTERAYVTVERERIIFSVTSYNYCISNLIVIETTIFINHNC